jgi:hypothetical protein
MDLTQRREEAKAQRISGEQFKNFASFILCALCVKNSQTKKAADKFTDSQTSKSRI